MESPTATSCHSAGGAVVVVGDVVVVGAAEVVGPGSALAPVEDWSVELPPHAAATATTRIRGDSSRRRIENVLADGDAVDAMDRSS
jgi:hypothetical protein